MTAVLLLTVSLTTVCLISQIVLLLYASPSLGQSLSSTSFNEFDWRLSKAVGAEINDNVVLSPIGVKTVLGMLYEGARGNTSRQIEDALNLVRETRAYTTYKFSEILRSLEEPRAEYDLDIGTNLFLEMNSRLNPQYEDTLKRVFNTSVQKVDYSNPENAVKIINKWAETATKGHIKNLLSEADAKEGILLLLLNAIYFKGQWSQQFPTNQTRKAEFKISSTQSAYVDFMTGNQTQKYTESEYLDASILRLPYMGDKFSMYIVLPNEVDGLQHLMNTITPDILRDLKPVMQDCELEVTLPKFTINFASSFRPVLEQLGLTDMFNEKADLSGISLDQKDRLMVSNVIQKAGIEVNEQGSTAYVATGAGIYSKFGEHTIYFVADHPFLFFIEDETTNTVVFLGKVVNPAPVGTPVVDKMTTQILQNMKPMITQPNYQNQPVGSQQWNPQRFNNTQGHQNQNSQPNSVGFQPATSGNSIQSSIGQGGIIEHNNFLNPGVGNRHEEAPSNNSYIPPPAGSVQTKYPGITSQISSAFESGGYYTNNGEYIKQNFDQERLSLFDTELIQNLCEAEGQRNWVISPASIKTVLGMIYEAAAEGTEAELASLLRLPKNKTKGLRMLHSVQRELHAPIGHLIQWLTANRLLVSNKLPILPDYKTAMSSMYRARVDQAKFDTPIQTAQEVNQWVNTTTKGFIPTLVDPGSLDRDAQLVLLNAVYFKGDWLYPFNKKFTQQQCFTVLTGECKITNMMNQRLFIKYSFNKQLLAHFFELPYTDTRFSMVVILPDNEGGIIDVVKNLPYTPLIPFINEMTPAEIQLSLPSFSVELSKDLSEIIKKMGGSSMFSDRADLRHMLGQRKGRLSSLIHKAKIVVNEKGTEAGAGTAAVIVPLMNTQLIHLSVNHPFLFYLRDQKSGFIFSGLIADPTLK